MKKKKDRKYKLVNKDYYELWMYFQSKATSVKGAMFSTITWILGFAAGLLGFIFVHVMDHDPCKAVLSIGTVIILLSLAGLTLCGYAYFAINESAKHISNNWSYADRCLKKIKGMGEIVDYNSDVNQKGLKIWDRLTIIVVLFAVAFLALLVWGFHLWWNHTF
jgi:hypothetical protein